MPRFLSFIGEIPYCPRTAVGISPEVTIFTNRVGASKGLNVEVTEVRIKLMDENADRLQAFCSITLDHEFVVRDLKIIDGQRGPFIAMPSRKLTKKCDQCRHKNEIRARFCGGCGGALAALRLEERPRLFADIAHPINAACRKKIEATVLQALEEERIAARQPGYVCTYDDFDEFCATS